VPKGVIIKQDPPAGTELAKGSTVTVWVSQGPQFISFPKLDGQPYDQALRQLQSLGLNVNRVEEPSQTVPEGQVIRTDPPGPGQVPSGGTVTVYVSMGDKVKVPDVYKMPYQQAVQVLQSAGLVVGSVSPQTCNYIRTHGAPNFDCASFPNGGVVSGTLQWNTWVPRGARIDIAYYQATPSGQ